VFKQRIEIIAHILKKGNQNDGCDRVMGASASTPTSLHPIVGVDAAAPTVESF